VPLLSIENLAVTFRSFNGTVNAVRSLSLDIEQGETHCLVGESGCGKSVSSFAIMGLLPGTGKITNGTITFDGSDITTLSERELRSIRGRDIAMIFQDPMTSLNPVYRCGDQVMEAILLHQNVNNTEARKRCIELFHQVKIPDPEQRVDNYPHELSGGMRQRVMIAMALACEPKLLIADEPTTALDVTVQAQILELLKELQSKRNMAILFITHDLGVVAEMADQVTVLYAGCVAENASVKELFTNPRHPYTNGLMSAVSSLESGTSRLTTIDGVVPEGTSEIIGCPFEDRCNYADDLCDSFPEKQSTKTHHFFCHHPITKILN